MYVQNKGAVTSNKLSIYYKPYKEPKKTKIWIKKNSVFGLFRRGVVGGGLCAATVMKNATHELLKR